VPSQADPGDAGWHIEGSFDVGGEWWVNYRSRGRGLLALYLFSDVDAGDVFLCHPFLVHAASWPHTGRQPRIMAQPGVALHDAFPLVPPLSPGRARHGRGRLTLRISLDPAGPARRAHRALP